MAKLLSLLYSTAYLVPFVNIITIIRPTVGPWAVVKGGRPP